MSYGVNQSSWSRLFLLQNFMNIDGKIKVVPSIFMKFWSRNNLEELDLLTAQDIYYTVILSKNIHKITKTDYVWFLFLWIRRYSQFTGQKNDKSHICVMGWNYEMTSFFPKFRRMIFSCICIFQWFAVQMQCKCG